MGRSAIGWTTGVVVEAAAAPNRLFLFPPVDRAPVLHAARLDLDVKAAVEQVLEREHLAGAQQRDAEADVQARGDLLADAEDAAAEGARFGQAGVVEADLAADLPGQQAAAGVERGGGGIELVAFVAGQVGGGAPEREVGQRV